MNDSLAAATEALVFATWALVLIGAVQLIADDYLAVYFPSQRPPKQPRRDYGKREADALSRAWSGGLGDA